MGGSADDRQVDVGQQLRRHCTNRRDFDVAERTQSRADRLGDLPGVASLGYSSRTLRSVLANRGDSSCSRCRTAVHGRSPRVLGVHRVENETA
jgi:hypothetical protein